MPDLKRTIRSLSRDKSFALALLAGPVFWWIYSQFFASAQGREMDWGVIALLCIVYPILEELCFRGALQGTLWRTDWGPRKWGGVSRANVLSSAMFAAFHVLSQSPLWAIAVFFPAVVFGHFRDRYNSTAPGIILHGFYNAGFYLWAT